MRSQPALYGIGGSPPLVPSLRATSARVATVPGLGRQRRHAQTSDDTTTFTITLTGADLVRWHALARKQGITFEQLVREAVEMAIARGASR